MSGRLVRCPRHHDGERPIGHTPFSILRRTHSCFRQARFRTSIRIKIITATSRFEPLKPQQQTSAGTMFRWPQMRNDMQYRSTLASSHLLQLPLQSQYRRQTCAALDLNIRVNGTITELTSSSPKQLIASFIHRLLQIVEIFVAKST
jgi:hypothetical protein